MVALDCELRRAFSNRDLRAAWTLVRKQGIHILLVAALSPGEETYTRRAALWAASAEEWAAPTMDAEYVDAVAALATADIPSLASDARHYEYVVRLVARSEARVATERGREEIADLHQSIRQALGSWVAGRSSTAPIALASWLGQGYLGLAAWWLDAVIEQLPRAKPLFELGQVMLKSEERRSNGAGVAAFTADLLGDPALATTTTDPDTAARAVRLLVSLRQSTRDAEVLGRISPELSSLYVRELAPEVLRSLAVLLRASEPLGDRDAHTILGAALAPDSSPVSRVGTVATSTPRSAAQDLLFRLGLATPPVDVWNVAHALGLAVKVAPLAGSDGCYVGYGPYTPCIVVREDMAEVRRRFTLAHEIGHHLLHSDEAITERVREWARSSEEREANQFAAALLMPERYVGQLVRREPVSMALLDAIVRDCQVSRQAAAIRAVEKSRYRQALFLIEQDRVKAASRSDELHACGIGVVENDAGLPARSLYATARRAGHDAPEVWGDGTSDVWLLGGHEAREEYWYSPTYDYGLVLCTLSEDEDATDDYDG